MIYPVFFVGMYVLHLLLKLHWVTTLILAVFGLIMLQKHRRLFLKMREQRQRFTDGADYLDTLLYAFAKEEKVDRALENAEAALIGPVKHAVQDALEHLRMTYDDSDVMRESLRIVEKSYGCARIAAVHDFIVHVENYGGRIDRAIDLLLSDKKRWERRILLAIKERSKMFTDIVMSIAASLVICGIILYMPAIRLDISGNVLCQILTVIMVVLDDFILLRAQKMMAPDWLAMDSRGTSDDAKRMADYKNYRETKARRLSRILAVPCLFGAAIAGWLGKRVLFAVMLVMMLVMLNQHKIGHRLSRQSLVKSIRCAFPNWLMEIVLLLQSENVQVAIQKSIGHAPPVLAEDLEELNDRMEMEPESPEPYHAFLREFEISEVHAAMSMLYSVSMGHTYRADRQLGELIDRNLEMLDAAEKEHIANLGSGMYLLFLAPVLTASFKLVVDMGVFMLSFFTGVGI